MNFLPERLTMLEEPVVAIVETFESPKSIRVECAATSWAAKIHGVASQHTLSPGQEVTVVGIKGITLLIVI